VTRFTPKGVCRVGSGNPVSREKNSNPRLSSKKKIANFVSKPFIFDPFALLQFVVEQEVMEPYLGRERFFSFQHLDGQGVTPSATSASLPEWPAG
jgi:hypothetical protein